MTPEITTIESLVKAGAIREIQDGNHGANHPKSADYVADGVPFIMGSNILDGRVDLVGCKRISLEQALCLRVGFARPGDVLLTHKGTMGLTAIAPHVEAPFLMLTPQVTYYRVDPARLDRHYLRYAFDDPWFQHRLLAVSDQSTRPFVSISDQRRLSIRLLPWDQQKRISWALRSIDELIELILRRVGVLESLAEHLFVDHLNRNGSLLSLLGEVADVNPETLVPEWGRVYKYVDIASVSPGRIEQGEPIPAESLPGRARRGVRHGDIIWSCVRPNRRSFAAIVDPPDDVVVSTGFAVLRPRVVPPSVLYMALTRDAFVAFLEGRARGAAYPAVTAQDFVEATLTLPPLETCVSLEATLTPLLSLKECLLRRSANLRKLRDLLLPKLLSGEIDASRLPLPPEEPEVEAPPPLPDPPRRGRRRKESA
ncbi:MAG: restriction endonuclease subunit S [Polyangiales bacterium]